MQLRKETHVGYQAELDQCGHEEKDLGLDMSGGVTEGKQRASTCCYQAEKGLVSMSKAGPGVSKSKTIMLNSFISRRTQLPGKTRQMWSRGPAAQ